MNSTDINLLTVFDYSVTFEELKKLLIFHYEKDEYLANTCFTTRMADLAVLFKYRGDFSNFKRYISLAAECNKILKYESESIIYEESYTDNF